MDPTVTARLYTDEAVGERRRLLTDSRERPFRLEIRQTRALSPEPRLGEVWTGRLEAQTPDRKDWFVDLGCGPSGVLSGLSGDKYHSGAIVAVRVRAEAWADKGPILELRPEPPGAKAGLLHVAEADAFLAGIETEPAPDEDARRQIDAAIELALSRIVPLRGGGDISLEQTRALLAIDIDAGGRAAGKGFAVRLNTEAAEEAARQIALRNAAGLVVIDFLPAPGGDASRDLIDRFKQALETHLGRKADVLPMSRLGLCEVSISRRSRPLSRALALQTPMRTGLDLIRHIETEGVANRRARIIARAPEAVLDWLAHAPFDWQEDLANRIGRRWRLEPGDAPQVWSET
jgi:hypothetical protein